MTKKRPYIAENLVNDAVGLWKNRHGIKSNFSESTVLEDILKEWIDMVMREKK